jgi:hypothetical protein
MKKLVLALFCCFGTAQLFAQKIEITAGLHTGFMHFAGKSTQSTSFINSFTSVYTNNTYGRNSGTGFGADVQAQLVLLKSFIIGVQGGYEALKSNIDINSINISDASIAATGTTSFKANYININPYIGYRLPVPVINVDVLAGLDIAYVSNAKDKGSVKDSNGTIYNVDRKVTTISTDNRVRFGVAASFKRIGVTANYSRGLTNYYEGIIGGGPMDAHSEIVRLGLTYKMF